MHAWIGLGSNLDDPHAQLQRAVDALASLPGTRLVAVSPVYRNPPMLLPENPQANQPEYCNAVAGIETSLSPLELLDALQAIENAQGRVRVQRWGARTLDLDLLLYGDVTITTPRLTVPHPGMRDRRFVLLPLADLAPDLVVPGSGSIRALLAACPPAPLQRDGDLQKPA